MKKLLLFGTFSLLILLCAGIVFGTSYYKSDDTTISYKTIKRKLSNVEYMEGKKKGIYKLNSEPQKNIHFVRFDDLSITKTKRGRFGYNSHIDTVATRVVQEKDCWCN